MDIPAGFAGGNIKKNNLTKVKLFFYRDEWIRTIDHLNPIQVLYQTELHPECFFQI